MESLPRLLLLVGMISATTALTCYECTNCPAHYLGQPIDCSHLNNPTCYVNVTGEGNVTRYCDTDELAKTLTFNCTRYAKNRLSTCKCIEDLCNGVHWFCYTCMNCGQDVGFPEECSNHQNFTRSCFFGRQADGKSYRECGTRSLDTFVINNGCRVVGNYHVCRCSTMNCNRYPDMVDQSASARRTSPKTTDNEKEQTTSAPPTLPHHPLELWRRVVPPATNTAFCKLPTVLVYLFALTLYYLF